MSNAMAETQMTKESLEAGEPRYVRWVWSLSEPSGTIQWSADSGTWPAEWTPPINESAVTLDGLSGSRVDPAAIRAEAASAERARIIAKLEKLKPSRLWFDEQIGAERMLQRVLAAVREDEE